MTKLLKPEEVAAMWSVSPLTIRKWIFARRLPVVRIGRSVRIRQEDAEAFIRLGLTPAQRAGRR